MRRTTWFSVFCLLLLQAGPIWALPSWAFPPGSPGKPGTSMISGSGPSLGRGPVGMKSFPVEEETPLGPKAVQGLAGSAGTENNLKWSWTTPADSTDGVTACDSVIVCQSSSAITDESSWLAATSLRRRASLSVSASDTANWGLGTEGSTYYGSVRYKTAALLGPIVSASYTIASYPPKAVTSLAYSSETDQIITWGWTTVADSVSGVKCDSVIAKTNTTGFANETAWTNGTQIKRAASADIGVADNSAMLAACTPGQVNYVCVRYKDAAGNLGPIVVAQQTCGGSWFVHGRSFTANAAVDFTDSMSVSGTNRLLVVKIYSSDLGDGGAPDGAPTYNDVSMTAVDSYTPVTVGGVQMFYLVAPATGNHTLYLGFFGPVNYFCVVECWDGVHQTTPIGSHGYAVSIGTTPTINLATVETGNKATDAVIVDDLNIGGAPSGVLNIGAGQTEIARTSYGLTALWEWIGSSYESGAGGTVTMSWTYTVAGKEWAIAAAELNKSVW